MHWAIALCISFMLITIFLRMGWMNKDNMAAIIDAKAQTLNIPVTHDQSVIIAKGIRAPMWNWHIITGYILIGLYAIRLTLPLFGKMKFLNPFSKTSSRIQKFKATVYLVFYFFLGLSLLTGAMMELGSEALKESLEPFHELALFYLIPFIIVHFAGIILAERGTKKGIVSRVIFG